LRHLGFKGEVKGVREGVSLRSRKRASYPGVMAAVPEPEEVIASGPFDDVEMRVLV
jgi:hypothetical protein